MTPSTIAAPRVASLIAPMVTTIPESRLVDGVASEFVAQRGEDAHREGVVVAGVEAVEQRGREDVRGDGALDGFLDRPAALAGVVDVALQAVQRWVGLEGV